YSLQLFLNITKTSKYHEKSEIYPERKRNTNALVQCGRRYERKTTTTFASWYRRTDRSRNAGATVSVGSDQTGSKSGKVDPHTGRSAGCIFHLASHTALQGLRSGESFGYSG